MESGYDECLDENPFFQALATKGRTIYETASLSRWTICIPRKGTTGRSHFNTEHFATHILKPQGENNYETANGKEVQINGSFIVTSKGFSHVKSVKILFEETYFNPKDESYHVLCIDHPLEGGSSVPLETVVPNLETLENCNDFLWSGNHGRRTKRQIDEILSLFNANYKRLENQSVRHTMDAANAVFTRALQSALKEPHLGRTARTSKVFLDNVKVAVETYIMDGLYKRIFGGLSLFLAGKDAALNKVTRNLADLQVKDLGVRQELCKNIPKAKRILSKLNEFTTPLEKLYVLKLTMTTISESIHFQTEGDTSNAVTADDLLVVLVFLVVKSEIPNWLANLTYMHNFHFSRCKSDEFQFYLASTEAAVEYVRNGKLDNVMKTSRVTGQTIKSGFADKVGDNGKTNDPSLLDKLYKCVIDGDEENALQILKNNAANEKKDIAVLLCHPLCSCPKCEQIIISKRSDPLAVTVFSRDDTGATLLHVAAEFGHQSIAIMLIKQEAIVNATNYHGDTPLHFACARGHKSVTMILIHYGADVNVVDNDGNAPLHLAVANGHEDVTEALVYPSPSSKMSTNINIANEQGDTPLHIASRWGFSGIVKILIDSGAAVAVKNKMLQTPRHCALNSKVQCLLDAAVKDDREHSAIPMKQEMLLPCYSREQVVHSSEYRKRKSEEFERLIKAVIDGDHELVRYKLGIPAESEEEGTAVERDSRKEKSLCHPLCQCRKCCNSHKNPVHESVVLSANMATKDGVTPLHFAALHGFQQIVALLLRKANANPNLKTKSSERSPLHLACQYNHLECVSSLLKHGAKVNTKDSNGNTPLHFCCTNGHIAPAILLLQNKANANAKNKRGNTPLHDASRWHHIDICKVLLSHGADTEAKNNSQLTPGQCARSDDMVDFFANYLHTEENECHEKHVHQPDTHKVDKGIHAAIFPDSKDGLNDDIFSSINNLSHSAFVKRHSITSSTTSLDSNTCSSVGRRKSITNSSTSSEDDIFCNSSPIDKEALPSKTNVGAAKRKTTVHSLFQAFEESDVEKLRQIANSIRTFDRRLSLRRVDTVDRSVPIVDQHVRQMFCIQHFDKKLLKHVQSRETTTTPDRELPEHGIAGLAELESSNIPEHEVADLTEYEIGGLPEHEIADFSEQKTANLFEAEIDELPT